MLLHLHFLHCPLVLRRLHHEEFATFLPAQDRRRPRAFQDQRQLSEGFSLAQTPHHLSVDLNAHLPTPNHKKAAADIALPENKPLCVLIPSKYHLLGNSFEFALAESAEEGVRLKTGDCEGELFVSEFVGADLEVFGDGIGVQVLLAVAVSDAHFLGRVGWLGHRYRVRLSATHDIL